MTATPASITDANQIPDSMMATILRDVVGFKRKHEGLIHVVKASGKIVDNPDIRKNFAMQVTAMRRDLGLKVVVVHGAGKQINAALTKAGFKSRPSVKNLRVTDAEHVETIDRVVRETNRTLCDMFGEVSEGDVLPMGMNGYDPQLGMLSTPMDIADNNYSGEIITSVNPWNLQRYLNDAKAIPIITNMCGIEDPINGVTKINVNADTVACALAIPLKAHRLLMCSDVDGVKDESGKVLSELSAIQIADLKQRKIIVDGMAVKVEQAFDTASKLPAESGVVIMDENFLMELLTRKGHGTLIRGENYIPSFTAAK